MSLALYLTRWICGETKAEIEVRSSQNTLKRNNEARMQWKLKLR